MKSSVILFALLSISVESTGFQPIVQRCYDKIIKSLNNPSAGLDQTQVESMSLILQQAMITDYSKQLNLVFPVSTQSSELIFKLGDKVIAELKATTQLTLPTFGKFLFNLEARTPEGIWALKTIAAALSTYTGLTVEQKAKISIVIEEFAVTTFGLPGIIVPIAKIIPTARLLVLGERIIQAAMSTTIITQKMVLEFMESARIELNVQSLNTVIKKIEDPLTDTNKAVLQLNTYKAIHNSFNPYHVMEIIHKTSNNDLDDAADDLVSAVVKGEESSVQAENFIQKLLLKGGSNGLYVMHSILLASLSLIVRIIF